MPPDQTNVRARFVFAYLWANIALGTAILLWAAANWHFEDPFRFFVFLASAVVASVLKIRLPGVTGTASVSVLVVLISIVNLSLPEALAIGTSSMLAQCLWRTTTRPRATQVWFNVSTLATGICVSTLVFEYARARTFEFFGLAVLSLVYFLTNTFLIAAIISLTESKRLSTVWSGYRWALAYYLVGASLAWLIETVPHAVQWELPIICLPLVYLVHRSNSTYMVQMEREKRHIEQMNAVHLRTIEALALAIDAKDHTTHDHLERVQLYATEIGKDLKLSEEEMEALQAAAVLHDIGKLAVPEHIISKPGKLTRSEFEKMKIHPVVGAEILERVAFPYPVVPIVRAHHEKWDGSGYPFGAKGEEIPIGARILAVVDCLDALASDRQYRRALPLDEAMAKVSSEAGTSFDPAVVKALQARYQELELRVRNLKPQLQPALSTDMKITRGEAPAAGFENEEAPDAQEISRLQAAVQDPEAVDCSGPASEAPFGRGDSLELREILAIVSMRLKKVVQFDAIAFYLWDDDALRAEFSAGHDDQRLAALRVPAGQGLIGWVAEVGKPIINGNPAVEPGFLDDQSAAPVLNLALALPFPSAGEKPGVLTVYRSSNTKFTADDLAGLLPACRQLERILIEKRRREAQPVSVSAA